MKNKIIWTVVFIVLLASGIFLLTRFGGEKVPDSEILSRDGLHWHSTLKIYVNGEQVSIPGDIGIGAIHNPVHTHDPDGTIHLEFAGVVRKDDTMLGEFFKNWNKDMRSFGQNMTMKVNGEMNTEFERYLMHDGDTIELYYE